ncbi:MAG: DUF2023 family protein [Oligoflexia bacterium]|nr:DUF2023 family protein [Oligoflexia bacterium]
MKIFHHHIYEYKKGLRDLVLCTMDSANQLLIEQKLDLNNIVFIIWPLNNNKINVFFGHLSCVNVIKCFRKNSLQQLTVEEDFILGIMLGYNRTLQCERYLQRKKKATALAKIQYLTGHNKKWID